MKALIAAVVCAALLPAAAVAQLSVIDDGRGVPAATQIPPDSKAEPRDGQPRICKRLGVTGTRLGGTKSCKTREEWAAISRDQKAIIDDVQRANLTQNCAGRPGSPC